ncbi:MAG: hypothetical protein ABIO35_06165 [Nitrobacter sp.]
MGKSAVGAAAAVAALSCLSVASSQAKDADFKDGLFQHCATVRNDDTVRGYELSLRDPTLKGFKALFPNAWGKSNPSDFVTQAQYRCMDGKVMVCFSGRIYLAQKSKPPKTIPA